MAFVINWPPEKSYKEPGGTEYLEIDFNNLDQVKKLKETRISLCNSDELVYWKVKCKLSDDRQQIIVKYEEDMQDDKLRDVRSRYCYGTLRIILKQDQGHDGDQVRTTGNFKWEAENGDTHEGCWSVLDISRNWTTRELRDRDSGFREKVLNADDRKCVITKETLERVLDAAHICSVTESDNDGIDNGITLRTDIHRLYDRKMFLIHPKSGRPTHLHEDLKSSKAKYWKLLRDAELPPKTLERVRRALQHKWNNTPGA